MINVTRDRLDFGVLFISRRAQVWSLRKVLSRESELRIADASCVAGDNGALGALFRTDGTEMVKEKLTGQNRITS
jgi:hypothetical protein